MPTVIEAPEVELYAPEYEPRNDSPPMALPLSPPPARRSSVRGMLRAMMNVMRLRPSVHPQSCVSRVPFETPLDILAREHPDLFLRAFCM